MPESVCFSMIFGNGLGRSFSPSSNSSWCTCFTYPCGSRRRPSADKRNFVVIRPPPAGLVPRSRHLVTKSSTDEMRVFQDRSIQLDLDTCFGLISRFENPYPIWQPCSQVELDHRTLR